MIETTDGTTTTETTAIGDEIGARERSLSATVAETIVTKTEIVTKIETEPRTGTGIKIATRIEPRTATGTRIEPGTRTAIATGTETAAATTVSN